MNMNSSSYSSNNFQQSQQEILRAIHQLNMNVTQLTTKVDRMEEANDRRSVSFLNKFEEIERKISALEQCHNISSVLPSSFNGLSSTSSCESITFANFSEAHFTAPIIESTFGRVTKKVCAVIR
jgi:hypothetical protein